MPLYYTIPCHAIPYHTIIPYDAIPYTIYHIPYTIYHILYARPHHAQILPEVRVQLDLPHPKDDISWLLMGYGKWVRQPDGQQDMQFEVGTRDMEFEVAWAAGELAIAASVVSAMQMVSSSNTSALPIGHRCGMEAIETFLEVMSDSK